MHVIVRQGNGKYYVSAVFGIYRDTDEEKDDFLLDDKSAYYIILNEEKTALVRQYYTDYSINYGIRTILEVESSAEGWTVDNNGLGGVDFLPKALALKLTDGKVIPQSLLQKCLEIDRSFCYDEYREVLGEKDAADFRAATNDLYEVKLKAFVELEPGEYYALFEDGWGFDLEMWFGGNVNYNLQSDLYRCNSKWIGAQFGIYNGTIYLTDSFDGPEAIFDDEPALDEYRQSCFRWIKAERARYRIIPL